MTSPNYRPDIDGLRAVAVMAVVLHHLSASLVPGGYVGVDVFFVISGYLITRIIRREMEEGTFTFARFYERRARRIFPALFAVLGVTLAVGYFLLLPSDYVATLRGALGTLFFSSNIVFWRDFVHGYFAATDAALNPLMHTWSLAVEEQFYVFFPVLLLLCFRYFRRHTAMILVACAVVSLACAALLVQGKSVAVFFLSPFRAWELLAGSLLAFNAVPAVKLRPIRELVSGAGLLAILVSCFLYDDKTTFPGLAALAPVLGAAAIIHAGASGPSLAGHLLKWRPVVYIGLTSYSLYLWHWPLIVLVRYAMGMEPIAPYIPVLLVTSLALGSLSYHFIEQPFRRGVRVTRNFVFSSSAVFASVLTLASVVGLVSGGFVERFSPVVVKLDEARSPKSQIFLQECDGKAVETGCLLGRADGRPTVLLWGDSHMLHWAPTFNAILMKQGVRAVLMFSASCPPLMGVDNNMGHYGAACPRHNLMVKEYLQSNPEIKMVVLSAFWSRYFREDGPLTAQIGKPSTKASAAASNALASILQWLSDGGRQVVLIGPVPVYNKSVPLALALEQAGLHKFARSSLFSEQQKNALFTGAVEASMRHGSSFTFLDPLKWICSKECAVMKSGVSMYFDSHHLSEAGAMALEPRLSLELITALSKRRDVKSAAAQTAP